MNEVRKTRPPNFIWLQVDREEPPIEGAFMPGVTWSNSHVFKDDVEYVRGDIYDVVVEQLREAQA